MNKEERELNTLSILDLPHRNDIFDYNYKTEWHEDFLIGVSSFFENIWYNMRNIYTGIKNIIIYAPIIYNTREWDYDYLLELIKFKLQRMSKDMMQDKTVKEYAKYSNEMNKVIDYIYLFTNSIEVYEKEHQDELKTIIDEKDEYKAEDLTGEFFTNTYRFEEDCWNKIWDNIKEFGRSWWT